jgi:hypothetical protein
MRWKEATPKQYVVETENDRHSPRLSLHQAKPSEETLSMA